MSASEDGTVRVWDATDGTAVVTLTVYAAATSAGFGPRDDRVVSVGEDPAGPAIRISPCDVCGAFGDALRLARSRPSRPLSPTDRRQLLAGGGSP